MVKAIYENNVLKPLEKLNLKDGEVVEVEIINRMRTGSSACWKMSIWTQWISNTR
jgi:predicted DNA-binding antitoxin AbrB/MazE fold protein